MNLSFEKTKQSIIFCFHVIIDFKMYMNKSSEFFLSKSSYKMLKWFYIFPMDTDKKGGIRGFYLYIKIIRFFSYIYGSKRDSNICKECFKEGFHNKEN